MEKLLFLKAYEILKRFGELNIKCNDINVKQDS